MTSDGWPGTPRQARLSRVGVMPIPAADTAVEPCSRKRASTSSEGAARARTRGSGRGIDLGLHACMYFADEPARHAWRLAQPRLAALAGEAEALRRTAPGAGWLPAT